MDVGELIGDVISRLCYGEYWRGDNDRINVMYEMRNTQLFVKGDIQRLDLIAKLFPGCNRHPSPRSIQFLVDWDPTLLTRGTKKSKKGTLLLHQSVMKCDKLTLFSIVFGLGVKHFPAKLGFLYQTNKDGLTPFAMACKKFGKKKITNVVNGVLSENIGFTKNILKSLVSLAADESVLFEGVYEFLFLLNKDGLTPFAIACDNFGNEKVTNVVNNILSAKNDAVNKTLEFFVSLAVDESIHCESIYFLLRRDPSILAKVVSKKGEKGHRKRQKKEGRGTNEERKRKKMNGW